MTPDDARDSVPRLARNPVSIAGAWLTTLSVIAFCAYVALEQFGLLASPYAGLFGFVFAPACFLFGLLLIPIGIGIEGRRRRRGRAAWRWPAIDLSDARTRTVLVAIAGLTIINLAIVSVAGVGLVHYSESNEFCGGLCHVPMEPEATAHEQNAHSRVDCVACHVGPGVSGAVTAKMNGTRQLWGVITGNYHRPIPSPRERMPVPGQTCNRCHAPVAPDRTVQRVFREHKDNETSSEITTTLLMYTGKNHWHARPDVVVEFAAEADDLKTIPYVKVTENGKVTEYFAEGVTAPPQGRPLVRMDCVDCHNRPAHTLAQTPAQVVDQAIVRREIDTALPFARSEMVEALGAEYPAGTDARQAIAARLTEKFGTSPAAKQAVAVAIRLYSEHVFPRMNVTWDTYTNQLFHIDDTGCFRCHTDEHKTKDAEPKVVRQDCDLCHLEQ
ncbi:MAG: NapC/NirT family cytochrome c [Acidobacteria bacterium]|nr:NapC/NirT family cytochrome c [Acidobacteriota bacterium]